MKMVFQVKHFIKLIHMNNSPNSSQMQKIGLFSTIMIVTGSMVGSGIFKDPTDIAVALGIPIWYLLIWVIAGILTLIGALSNAEVASMFPKTGGQYIFFKEMYGDVVAFFYGWSIFAVIQTGSIASIAYVFSEYAQTFIQFPRFSVSIEQSVHLYLPFVGTFYPLKEIGLKLITVGIILFLTFVNILGVRSGSLVQNVFTVAKFLAIGLLIICSLIFAQNGTAHFHFSQSIVSHNNLSFLMGFIVAIQAAFWSYDGWNNITYVAGEVNKPQKTIPNALIIGTISVIVFYVLTNAAFLYVLPLSSIASSSLLAKDVATVIFGGVGGYLVASAVMISTFGTTNGTILASARVYQAMAEDGYFFRSMKDIHHSFHTPHKALILQAVWTSLLVFSGTFRALTSMLIFVTWIYYALGVIGLFILRKKLPNAKRPYKVIFYPYLPIIFVIFATAFVFLTLYTDIQMYVNGKVEIIHSLYGLFLVATGIPFYFYFRKKLFT